jgi:sigma-B regulation protein RsbU (phosphoserine phosphatase)
MALPDLMRLAVRSDAAKDDDGAERFTSVLAGDADSMSEERLLRRKDGRAFWAAVSIASVRGPGGQPTEIVGTMMDVSEQKEKLDRAARMQRDLLPDSAPVIPGYDLAGTCVAVDEVGGDFYDWYQNDPHTLTISLGDVMGKGLSAAILMAAVRTALRAASGLPTLEAAIKSAADSIELNLEKAEAFVTLFDLRLELPTGLVHYVDAGHGLALRIRPDGEVTWLRSTDTPLGIIHGQTYHESSTTLDQGDCLLVFSDGVLDAYPDIAQAERSVVSVAGLASAREIVEKLAGIAWAARPGDDVTVVALRRCGVDQGGR